MIRQGERFGSWAVVGRYENSPAFVCRHVATGSRGLLYVTDPENGMPVERVRRKAELLACLNHPACLQIFEVHPGEGWLVTELAGGDNLKNKLEGSVVELVDVLRMGRMIADALDLAHSQGIHHWQLQPHRIVFWREKVKLLDFQEAQQPLQVSETPSSEIFPYLPPEVHRDGSATGIQWDLYALGVTMYECLSGDRAHMPSEQKGDVPTWMVRDKLRRADLDPGPAYPQPVRQLVRRATALKPRRRFADAASFRDAVSHTERVLAHGTRGLSNLQRGIFRFMLATLLLTLVGGLGVMFAGFDAQQFMGATTRPVRLIVNSEDPTAINKVTMNGELPTQSMGTSFYFAGVQVGPADVHVTSGKGCGPPYCPGEKCPFCCTAARVTRTVESGNGEQNLVIPVQANDNDQPRPVLIIAPELAPGVRMRASLFGANGTPEANRDVSKGGVHFPRVLPGSYEMLVEAGTCPRAAMGCYQAGNCPEGCESLLDVLLVPCGKGDLEIAADIPSPL